MFTLVHIRAFDSSEKIHREISILYSRLLADSNDSIIRIVAFKSSGLGSVSLTALRIALLNRPLGQTFVRHFGHLGSPTVCLLVTRLTSDVSSASHETFAERQGALIT